MIYQLEILIIKCLTISKLQIPYIIMHMKGIPKTMQKNPKYVNVVDEIIESFRKKAKNYIKMTTIILSLIWIWLVKH